MGGTMPLHDVFRGEAPMRGHQSAEPIRRRTLVTLRWVAVTGQLAAVITAWAIGARFPLLPVLALIALAGGLNILLTRRQSRVTDRRARQHLMLDAVQVGLLLTLTGGIANPFAPLMLVPVTIGAAALTLRDTIWLAMLTLVLISVMAVAAVPLVFAPDAPVAPALALQFGDWAALLVSGAFFAAYIGRVSRELAATSEALSATRLALAREQRLQHLGGIVAAAAHEMGTPLATIKLVGSELAAEIGELLPDRPDLAEDLALLRSSADRCRDILRSMGNAGKDDLHMHVAPLAQVLEEAADPHRDRGKAILIDAGKTGAVEVWREPGIVHALRNLIQNGVDFARSTVTITAIEAADSIKTVIRDDGPGFPAQLLPRLGDPFLTTRRSLSRGGDADEGLGLGLFIARTLLERSGATVSFANDQGARVEVEWPRRRIAADGRAALGSNPPIAS
ncbi:ActS/PrrB/RegB family redox-sensitive histidine kinase [uncultured Paracoccus sp.]|uniref:ActS/PrrB/RegB family redox-sensitive histidine kinase n=1 Tax=uncultured Paracoccus sp. TaxID=189685 RepID=UPI00261B6597|nr:ActS/PrrB/RegB family redox-sensitive histidine kinase [uncultured Paracoccus sp.]